jgi:hypothetical protein
MDFLASLLPIAISTVFSYRTAYLFLEPTSQISFFGLFWVPYHDDLPYCILSDGIIVSFLNVIFSLLAPRFPRLLKAYSKGASPQLPLNLQKLFPENPWWTITLLTLCLVGWLGNSMGLMGVAHKFMTALALYTLGAAIGVCIVLQARSILLIYIRYYPERPPLGLVTGLLWPPLHPLHRFLLRMGNKLHRSFENSPSEARETEEQCSAIHTEAA